MRTSQSPRSTFSLLVLGGALAVIGGCSSSSDTPAEEDTGATAVDSGTPSDAADTSAPTDGGDSSPSDVGVDAVDSTVACAPPKFGGLTKIDTIDATSVHLHWDSATDPKVPASGITYLGYAAPLGTSIDFTKPANSVVGASTEMIVSGLTKETEYFFVVRASNGSCADTNVLVRTATTSATCSFTQVQPIFDRNCAVAGCHILPAPPAGMTLSSGFSWDNTVNIDSVQDPTRKRVKPNDSDNSYLYRKITGRPVAGFNAMPPPGATSFPTTEEKDLIKCWIDHGALK